MPKTRAQKAEGVGLLARKFKQARAVVFASYEGLPVKDINELRRLCKKEKVEYTVAKKTLLKRAFTEASVNVDPKTIEGNFATVIGYEDEVAPARILEKFSKGHEALKIVAGVLEKSLIDRAAVLRLAALPSKPELLAKLVGTLNAPVSGFVNVLAGNLRNLVYVLNAIKNHKT